MKIQDPTLDRLVSASYLLEMGTDEVWREIDYLPEAETESRYFVSNYGSVISLYRNNPIVLKPFLCGNSGSQYYYVSICGKDYRINRLVAQAFIPNDDETKTIINHRNSIRDCNRVDNLEWCDYQYNNTYNDIHHRRMENYHHSNYKRDKIKDLYNPDLSARHNLEIFKANGIDCSRYTVIQLRRDLGLIK